MIEKSTTISDFIVPFLMMISAQENLAKVIEKWNWAFFCADSPAIKSKCSDKFSLVNDSFINIINKERKPNVVESDSNDACLTKHVGLCATR